MIEFQALKVGDYVHVEYDSGDRMDGCRVRGTLTRVWTPEEHGAGKWQGQVNKGWCFHETDRLLEHRTADKDGA